MPVVAFIYQQISEENSLFHDNIAHIANITITCLSILVICFLLHHRSRIHPITNVHRISSGIYHFGFRTTLPLAMITVISRAIPAFSVVNASRADKVFARFSVINCILTFIQLCFLTVFIDHEYCKRMQRKNSTTNIRRTFQKSSNLHLLHLTLSSNIALYLTDAFLHDQHETDLMIQLYGVGYTSININIYAPTLVLHRLFSCICLQALMQSTNTWENFHWNRLPKIWLGKH